MIWFSLPHYLPHILSFEQIFAAFSHATSISSFFKHDTDATKHCVHINLPDIKFISALFWQWSGNDVNVWCSLYEVLYGKVHQWKRKGLIHDKVLAQQVHCFTGCKWLFCHLRFSTVWHNRSAKNNPTENRLWSKHCAQIWFQRRLWGTYCYPTQNRIVSHFCCRSWRLCSALWRLSRSFIIFFMWSLECRFWMYANQQPPIPMTIETTSMKSFRWLCLFTTKKKHRCLVVHAKPNVI